MIRHILIVAWRNICKYKVSAGIAVVGLAMGLLCFVLCNFCARLFFSIDKVFPNYDRMAEIQIKVGEGEELQDYFDSKDWYLGYIEPEDFVETEELSKLERRNALFIRKFE